VTAMSSTSFQKATLSIQLDHSACTKFRRWTCCWCSLSSTSYSERVQNGREIRAAGNGVEVCIVVSRIRVFGVRHSLHEPK
jgi:hypothetical protein